MINGVTVQFAISLVVTKYKYAGTTSRKVNFLLLLTLLNVRNFFRAPGVSIYWFLNWRKYDYLSMYCDTILYN
jgi:hypothetical protein